MRINLFSVAKCMMLSTSILLMSCTEDVYVEKPGPDGSAGTIPSGFDFSSFTSQKLTVKVVDEFDGKYYYTVEVFDADPSRDPSAKLIVGAKTNKKVPFEMNVALPKVLKYVYVRMTDPVGYKYLTMMEVSKEGMVLDYSQPRGDKKATKSSTRAIDDKFYDKVETIDFDVLFNERIAGAEEVNGDMTLAVNGKYKITNKAYKGKITFPQGKFTLFVDKGCTLTLAENHNKMMAGAEIYVQATAFVEAGDAQFIDMEGQAKIFNAGTIHVGVIAMGGNAVTEVTRSIVYNHPGGKVYLQSLDMSGGEIYNHCLFTVAGDANLHTVGSNINLYSNSSFVADKFLRNSVSGLYMWAKSLFEVNVFKKIIQGDMSINGDDSYCTAADAPLFKVNNEMDCGVGYVIFQRYMFYKVPSVVKGLILNWATAIIGNIPTWVEGECYGKEYVPGEPEEPDTDPELPGGDAQNFVYMFEDNWPVMGDYDMNDVVVKIGVTNNMTENKVTSAVISGEVLAVGGTKELYLFATIDGTDKVFNLLGESNPELHAFMGVKQSDFVNTYNKTCDPKPFKVEIDVKGMEGIVNAKNLNVFIVWGKEPLKDKRNEVHIPGFKGTSKAATSATCSADYKYISGDEYNNFMWGLMVPEKDFASYPKETIKIMDAYPDFMKWANAGGTDAMDWYTNGIADKLYQGK